MKFAFVALLATVSAQVDCTDETEADACVDGGCCGWLWPSEGTLADEFIQQDGKRACGDAAGTAATDYDGTDSFTCEPREEEEGASKLTLGLSAVVAALYMA